MSKNANNAKENVSENGCSDNQQPEPSLDCDLFDFEFEDFEMEDLDFEMEDLDWSL